MVVVLVPFVSIAPYLFWQGHETSKSLHSFGDALAAKDYQRAYKLTYSGLQQLSSFDTFLHAHELLQNRVGDLKKLSWSSISVQKDGDYWYGTADCLLTFDRGTLPFTFVLRKDGSWRVYSYHEK